MASPLYCTVIECEPVASVEVTKFTDGATATVVKVTEPSKKLIVPLGAGALGQPGTAVKLAERVTAWPTEAVDVCEDTVIVVVPLGLTVREIGDETLGEKLLSPPYCAVTRCEPNVSEEVVKVACPPLRETVARTVAPSWKVTLPVGVPLPGGVGTTVAVSVTL